MIKNINEREFKLEIQKGVVLVDFYATWCPPCKMLAPVLESIADEYNIVKVNTDENINLAREYNIEVVPTLIVFKDGNVVDKLVGYSEKEDIIKLMNKYM